MITDGAGVLTFGDGGGNLVFYEVKNSTGSTIAKGTAVRVVGTDGNSGHKLIAPMVADGTVEPKYYIGVTYESITNGGIGKVVHFGEIDQVNTLAFNDGDVLWCDPANNGGFTTTEPNAPNVKLATAIVINSATNGKIFVRVQGNEGLHELHDVYTQSLVEGDILIYDGTNTYWKNSSQSNTAALMPSGTDAQRPTPAAGMIRFNTTSNEFEGYNGTEWAAIGGSNSASIDIDAFTGDGTTTAFTLTSEISQEDNTQVYIDGVYQSKANYTTSGTTLTFSTAPPTGTAIEVVNFTGIQESQMDGSGTANYVTKWLDSDTLTDSIITDDGSTVTVNGDAIVTGDLTVDTNTLYVDSADNRVGIGTTNPAQLLHITSAGSTVLFVEATGANDSRVRITAGDSNISYLEFGDTADSDTGEIRYEHATNNMQFRTNGNVERMRIDSSGRVAIGTTSINSKVQIEQPQQISGAFSNPFIKLSNSALTNNTGTTAIALATSTADNYGYAISAKRGTSGADSSFIITHHDNSLTGTERLRIDSSGNVGIGVSPIAKLHIKPTYATGYTGSFSGTASYEPTDSEILIKTQLGASALANDYIGIRFLVDGNTTGIASAGIYAVRESNEGNGNTSLTFATRSGTGPTTEKMRIDSSGNVGIGVTPSSWRATETVIQLPDAAFYSGNNYVAIGQNYYIPTTGGAVYEESNYASDYYQSGGTHVWRTAASGTAGNSITWSEAMRIDSSGRVGIGTTSPVNDVSGLHIAVASSTDQLYLERTGSGTGRWWLGTASNSLYFHDDVANSTRMVINSSGNVGIGTTSPAAKLDISFSGGGDSIKSASTNSTSYNSSKFYNDNSKGWHNLVYGSAYSSGSLLNVGADGATIYSNTTSGITTVGAFNLLFGTNSTERMRIDSSGVTTLTAEGYQLAIKDESSGNISEILTSNTAMGFFADRANAVASTSMIFSIDNDTKMTIDSSGNVKIKGTNTKLSWERTSDSAPDVVYLTKKEDISSNGNAKLHGYDGIVFSTAGTETERMRINSSGVVDIKSGGTAAAPSLILAGDSDTGWYRPTANTIGFSTAGNERMRVNTNGKVGIGTTSPAELLSVADNISLGTPRSTSSTEGDSKLILQGKNLLSGTNYYGDYGQILFNATSNYTGSARKWLITNALDAYKFSIINGGAGQATPAIGAYGGITTGTPALTIDHNNNVGIGTTSPAVLLDLNAGTITDIRIRGNQTVNSRLGGIAFYNTSANDVIAAINVDRDGANDAGAITFDTQPASGGNTERMRITSGGDVLVQAQSVAAAGLSIRPNATAGTVQQVFNRASTTSTSYIFDFQNAGTTVGYISYNNTSTNYNTSSDYRLKENVVPMEGALDRVDALKPSRFNFIANADKIVDGFLAHEVAEVVPEAISGEKDAVQEYEVTPAVLDDEGNVIEEAVMGTRPVYQGIDQSKLVPLLTAALQEAHTLIKDLTARIETLENQ
jgi:hypothetical protein